MGPIDDPTPVTRGELVALLATLTIEIVDALEISPKAADDRLVTIASRFLDFARETDNPRFAALFHALADVLVRTE